MSQEIRIPDIGDAESVEVVEILAAAGDAVGPDDPVIVIESDKASMEVPAGRSGVIERITVAVGDQVVAGQLIALLAGADGTALPPRPEPESERDPEPEPERGRGAAAPAVARSAAAAATPESAAALAATPPVSANPGGGKTHEVRVPDIGEADHVAVIEVAVAIGDQVEADDLLVVIESDKASMEIPVGVAGRVVAVHVAEGHEIREGTLLATIESGAAAAADRTAAPAPGRESRAGLAESPRPGARPSAATRPAPAAAPPAPAGAAAEVEPPPMSEARGPEPRSPEATTGAQVYAGPAVRQLARELGVSLERVTPTGPRGRIVKDDVQAYVKARMTAPPPAPSGSRLPPLPVVDFSRYGPIETVPLSRIRARGADNLHRSWVNVPHVTQHDEVDVTDLEAFRRALKAEAEAQGVRLTLLAFLIKACCQALREFPTVNSSLDPSARHFILKRYYHIGIAVDTDDGLVVPVLRDADRKGILTLAREVAELSDKARNRKLTPAEHQGGTFSITSLGALGGTGFTPIINAPEVAILGVGRLTTRPQWDGQGFVPRGMLPLSLSYDHRAINGAEAGRFLARLALLLRDIRRLAL